MKNSNILLFFTFKRFCATIGSTFKGDLFMYVAYETQCGNCMYFDYQGDNTKGYCSYYREYYYPGEECSHQEKRRDSEESSNCYITTIVCDLLGFDDKCDVLETLRGFRNKMQQDPKYKKILFEYDTVGPEIAKNLFEDKEYDLAEGMYSTYILSTVALIREQKYDEAVKKYSTMTKALKEYYGIKAETVVPANYDQKNGGHGKVLTI